MEVPYTFDINAFLIRFMLSIVSKHSEACIIGLLHIWLFILVIMVSAPSRNLIVQNPLKDIGNDVLHNRFRN